MNDYYVYMHTSPSGKKYIGVTQNYNKRWRNGLGYYKNKYFYNAIQKYGWENFKHEILFSGLTKEEAEQKEIELIAYYNSNKKEYGYNHAQGGLVNRGYKLSKETRFKLSESHKGLPSHNKGKRITYEQNIRLQKGRESYFEQYGHPFLGKHHTEETKEKISNANKGKSKNSGKDNPHYGKNLSELHRQKISNSMSGRKFSEKHKKHLSESKKNIKFSNEQKENMAKAHKKQFKKIIQKDLHGNIINIWDSIGEASRSTNISRNAISKCICKTTKNKTGGGFIWEECNHEEYQLGGVV